MTSRALHEIRRFNMFEDGERLLLALSGGKDSFVLLDVISSIHNTSKLGVITIVEGIPGYNREEDFLWIRRRCAELGVDYIKTSFKEFTGYDLRDLVALSKDIGVDVSPCTFCGMFRRRIVNTYARELGYDKVLTAHNLDDEAQTALINILRGDIGRLIQSHPKGPKLSDLFVRKVKPLRKVYEWENAIYAYLKGFKFQAMECPYITSEPTLRAKVRSYMYRLERVRPGTLLNFLNFIDDVIVRYVEEFHKMPHLPTCVKCGEPTAFGRELCKTCELLSKLGLKL